ncbi:hypothetical protein H0H87_002795 [Tephrocybe sp. NHM501043]|nr:hypothetical protein H0H87_002795 [Tephrocybe sp. NHM501043]
MANFSQLTKEAHIEALQEDEGIITSFCRALYEYKAQDASGLSFKPGDLIEVLNQEPSGWWDGLLGDERGWFPYNYVELISDEEAEHLISASESSGPDTLDLSHITTPKAAQYADDGRKSQARSPLNDFWMPQVTPEGQIFYKNTQTGQHSREIPHEVYDTGLEAKSPQLSSRPAGNGVSSPRFKRVQEPSKDKQGNAGFGRGMPHSFYNKVDGQIQWSNPRDPERSPLSTHAQPTLSGENKHCTTNSGDPVIPHYGQEPANNFVQPLRPSAGTGTQRADAVKFVLDRVTTEAIAQELQGTIAPASADLVTELASVTTSTIQAIIDNVQSNGEPRKGRDRSPSDLVGNVVLSVRNLLYAFGVPTHPMPPNLLPHPVPSSSQSPLNIAQRNTIASLSRLAFSARTIKSCARVMRSSAMSQIQADAELLLKDVASFVSEVNRQTEHDSALHHSKQQKRLRGALIPTNIGPGLVGAGAGGHWKGFGWVQLDNSQVSSQKVLGPSVISELRRRLNDLDVQFQYLSREIQTFVSVEQARLCGQELVSQVSSMLAFVSDVHVARHVDVDEFQQDESASGGPFGQTIRAARALVRTLEAVVQAMYDDIALFLLTLQSLPSELQTPQQRQKQKYTLSHLDAISSSLSANTSVLLDSLVGLLSLGHEQARMASGDYYGSAEWRTSRSSGRLLSAQTNDKEDETDLVNMEVAFTHGPEKSPEIAGTFPARKPAPSVVSSTTGSPLAEQESILLTQEEREWELIPAEDSRQVLGEGAMEGVKSPPRTTGSQKLEWILGDDYVRKVAADLKPHYLRPNYNPEDIQIEPDNSVRGGTLSALVERLTAHENVDPSFNRAFLTTFKLFMAVDQLFDILVARFRIEPPPSLKPKELEDWEEHKKHLVQIRVINMFVTMLKDHDVLDRTDITILERMRSFVLSDEVSQFGAAKQVLVCIDRLLKDGNIRTLPQSAPPPPIFPKANIVLKLGDIDPLELARQLTMVESKLYQKVRPMECLLRAREQRIETFDNITPIIQTSNRMADWVADLVLSKEDSRKRVTTLKQLIILADFIHDGNSDTLPGGLVNFRKHQMASEVINDIKRCQSQPFNFQVIPSVQTYIEESLNRYINTKASADRFWAMSLEREPRERDDERMARLLQETGFL